MSASIIQSERECFFCSALGMIGQYGAIPFSNNDGLEKHHIMFGYSSKARKYSEKYGLWVYLCPYHHKNAPESVHKSKSTNVLLRRVAQKAFMREHGDNAMSEWMQLFGKNYLDEEVEE